MVVDVELQFAAITSSDPDRDVFTYAQIKLKPVYWLVAMRTWKDLDC